MGWPGRNLLNYIETAIAENRPEFRKNVDIRRIDEFEEALPSNVMAKT
jgi:hypothetical protein